MYVKIFGVVNRMARDGSMFARRYDGRNEVFIYAGEAERAGLQLGPGSRIAWSAARLRRHAAGRCRDV